MKTICGPTYCLLVALLLSGCSTALEHKEAFTAFSASTEKASAALETYDKSAAKGMTELMISRAAALDPRVVSPADGSCRSADAGCALALRAEDGSKSPIVYKTLMPNHVAAAREVSAYAKSLADLAVADSAEQVQAALNQAKANATSLIQILYPAGGGAAATALAAPIAAAGSYLFRTWQEQTKMAALRRVTTDIDPIIQEVAQKFGAASEFVVEVDTNTRFQAWRIGQLNYLDSEPSNRAARLKEWINASQNYDDGLKAPLSLVFKEMGDAHSTLTSALQNRLENMNDFFLAVNRLKIQVEAVYGLVKGFQAAVAH